MIRYLQVAGDPAAEIPTTFRTAPLPIRSRCHSTLHSMDLDLVVFNSADSISCRTHLHERQWLQHSHSVPFGVSERYVRAHSRYLHRFIKWLASRLFYFFHVFPNVIHRNDDRGILIWSVVRSF